MASQDSVADLGGVSSGAPIVPGPASQPLIQASRLQVGKLLPEDATLCPAHEYLIVLSASPTELRYSREN